MKRRVNQRGPALPAPVARDASRQRSAGLFAGVLATLAVSVLAYAVSTRVAAERREVERLARANAALSVELLALEDELAVRTRLPQLQRWNDEVLFLAPVAAHQILKSPAELGLYAAAAPPPMAVAPLRVAQPEGPAAAPPAPPAPADDRPPAAPPAPALVLAAADAGSLLPGLPESLPRPPVPAPAAVSKP
ncbi:hypothetical protein [Thermaurantiacus sp.]